VEEEGVDWRILSLFFLFSAYTFLHLLPVLYVSLSVLFGSCQLFNFSVFCLCYVVEGGGLGFWDWDLYFGSFFFFSTK
jgi:hypothetical protein